MLGDTVTGYTGADRQQPTLSPGSRHRLATLSAMITFDIPPAESLSDFHGEETI